MSSSRKLELLRELRMIHENTTRPGHAGYEPRVFAWRVRQIEAELREAGVIA